MITLVKSESFKNFEKAYDAFSAIPYSEIKKSELERRCIGRRILHTKEEMINMIKGKEITEEDILNLVDSIRYGKTCLLNDVAMRISESDLLELVNDIGSKRINTVLKIWFSARNSGDPEIIQKSTMMEQKSLMRLITLIAIMVDVRINSYSCFRFSGAYDTWCKDDETATNSHEFLAIMEEEYRKRIFSKLAEHPDFKQADEFTRLKSSERILSRFSNNLDCCEDYGIEKDTISIYLVLHSLEILLCGMCEWFWNED